jgi:hypothetical protein
MSFPARQHAPIPAAALRAATALTAYNVRLSLADLKVVITYQGWRREVFIFLHRIVLTRGLNPW